MIAFEEYIELLKSMIKIPAFSREEGQVCDLLESWLQDHGADSVGDQYPLRRIGHNLILEQKGRGDGRPVLLLNGHIDTVKPADSYTRDPFVPVVEDGVLYGLGSNDDGGSVVALLATYLKLVTTDQPYRLVFAATAEEEVCGKEGIEKILPMLGDITLGVIGEPTMMQMAVAEKGLMVLDCTAYGKSGHAARNEGVNAIYEAMESIGWFRDYQFPKVSPFVGPVKMTVSMVNAGTQHNVVPDKCSFVVDVRPNGMYSNVELLSMIQDAVTCDVKARSTRLNSSHIAMEHPVVQKGLSMGLKAYGSPTCSNQTLCPFTTIKIGPGDSARSHTADEYIRIDEIRDGIDIFVELLDKLNL